MDLQFYLSLFLRRIHYFILAVVLCSTAGIFLAQSLPTVYQADAVLLVESEQIPGDLAASTVTINPREQLQIIQQRILTRDALIDLANRLNIYADRRAAGERPLDGQQIVTDLRGRININVSGRGSQATIIRISFAAPTGRLAADVTNELVTLILAEDVTMRTRTARQTLDFFEQKVADLDRELSERSGAILAFKESNIGSLSDSLDFRRSQQATAQERLLQTERQMAEIRERRDRLQELFDSNRDNLDQLIPQSQRTEEETRLQTLKDQRDQLLAILSPENPRVRLLDQQIAPLEERVAAQRGLATATNDDGQSPAQAQVMSAFELQMLDLEGQLEYLAEQRILLEDEIAALSASIVATPGNSIALETLERNYAATLRQYNQAITSLATAETGDTIEGLSKGRRISIVEPAVAPNGPTSPNRPLVAAAGIGGGMMLGLGLIVALEFLRSGIRRPVDLTKGLGITAFATLPYLKTRKEVMRRRMFVWGGVVTILCAVAIGVWAVDSYYMPLDQIVERLQRMLL